MNQITIKEVYDDKNAFSHLELWQGDAHIEVSLAATQLDIQEGSYKWDNLKKWVELHRERVQAVVGAPTDE